MLRIEIDINSQRINRELESVFYDTLSAISSKLPDTQVRGRVVVMQVPNPIFKDTAVEGIPQK